MEAKKSSGKQVVAILLLVIGLAAGVFGVLGLVGGGGMDPYEARNGVVMIGVMVQDSQGNTASGMGTGFAIGNPGEPVEYIVTNGHVVQKAYEYPRIDPSILAKVQVYYSASEHDYLQARVVCYILPSAQSIAI